jgi:hypothetical protein
MNAYAKGYRLLSGELQDFRPDWSRAQRQQAATDYRAWIDPREVNAKESDEDRARVVDALMLARSTERARPVVDWVGRTRPYLRHGAED